LVPGKVPFTPPDSLIAQVLSDSLHWLPIALYMAIAVLAFIPRTLHTEGVLLTVLKLPGVHVVPAADVLRGYAGPTS
jgi:hypothetical protein